MTIKDIAKLANVSPGTVSKIINGKADNIRPATRENVLNIVRQYHYSPGNFIRQNSVSRTYKIGLLLNRSFHNHVLLNSIVCAAKALGYYLLICCSDGDSQEEDKFLSFLAGEHADGILWERISNRGPLPNQLTGERGVPYLLLNDTEAPPQTQMDYAVYGRAAAEALFGQGHRRIAFLAEKDTYPERMIFEGICQYLRSRLIGIMAEDFRIFSPDAGFDLLKEGYTAAICSGDQVSACLSQQMSKLLSSIPQDFSVVALSSSPDGLDLPLSKLILPFAEYGEFLIRRLVQEIDREESFCTFTPTLPAALPLTSISTPKDYPSKHIIVVGSIHMDVNINSDNLPQLGRTSTVRGMSMIPGGKGINQAIGVAKLNKEVHLIGRIGSDFDGITIQDALGKYHVHSDGIVKDNSDTGRAFIFILGNGESAITNYDGANKNLSISDISRSSHLFRRADFCLLQTEIPMETVIYAAKLAKRNKVKIILKPAAITEISDELLSIVDYFVPNEKEIDLLCPYPLNHSQQCEYFLKKGVKTVILTMGNRGCYLYRKDDAQYFPASGHIAADTTGGSDAFISALATYLSENVELHQAIQYAIYAAGFCVSRQGVVPALIDRESLELYRKKEEAKAIQ